MAILILVLFIGVPLIEIALFIEVGGMIGLWPTVATVMLTAVIGTVLLRQQGMATLQRAQAEMAAQRMPVRELFDGACLLAAGILLLTPGFLTDTIGFVLLIPPLRGIVGRLLWQAVQRSGTVHVHAASYNARPEGRPDGRGPIIEAEYEDVTAPDENRRPLPGQANGSGGDSADRGGDAGSPWRREDR